MDVPVLDKQGKTVGSLTIDESSLGGEVNPALIKQAYVRYHANRRQGSARTKSRGMVAGSTRKLYKQKGTGHARMGPNRSNIRRGGGRAFAKTKTREDYRLDMPVKMRRRANRNALLAKLIDGEVKVIDDLTMSSPRTKDFKDPAGVVRGRPHVPGRGADGQHEHPAWRPQSRGRLAVQQRPADVLRDAQPQVPADLEADLESWLIASSGTAKGGKDRTSSKKREEAA